MITPKIIMATAYPIRIRFPARPIFMPARILGPQKRPQLPGSKKVNQGQVNFSHKKMGAEGRNRIDKYNQD